MRMPPRTYALFAAGLLFGCSSSSGGTAAKGSGGSSGSGGVGHNGGSGADGGAAGTGGLMGVGGAAVGGAVATVKFADVGLSGQVTVRDLWQKSDLGSFSDSYTATSVPSHGVVMLRLSQ